VSDDLSGFSLMELFRSEAEGQTAVLSQGLIEMERGPVPPATLEGMMRAAHSLKGAARIVGIDAAAGVAHVLEDYFVAAQKNLIEVLPQHVDVLLAGVDLLTEIAKLSDEESQTWLAQNESTVAAYVANFDSILSGDKSATAAEKVAPPPPPAPIPPPVPAHVEPEPPVVAEPEQAVAVEPAPVIEAVRAAPEKADRVVRVTADSLTRLLALAGESLVESRQFRPFVGALRQLKQTQAGLGDNLRALEQRLQDPGQGALQTARELVARVTDQAAKCQAQLTERIRELDDYAHRNEDLAGRLHHEIVASRMRPLADGVKAFPRMVRDVARQLGKQVQFEIRGENTGVDRDVLEKLEAPLNHLLRNSLDHGIELPEERVAAGKPAAGRVVLDACHRAGMLQITLRDDGRGVDRRRLKQKILDRALVSPAMAQQLSDAELLEFLFLPGLSTKESVTELSGRGVGLDVVQTMAKALGGTVRVTSTFGRETVFSLRLPITMSVLRALLVEIGGEPYAFPLTRIERICVLPAERIETMESRRYFTLDDQTIGLVEATQVLELPASLERNKTLFPVVVLSDRGHLFGLVVDRFLGERDLDVRPLDPRLGKVPNLGGASLLENGMPVLMFDVEDVVRSIDVLLTGRTLKWSAVELAAQRGRARHILVVDDSITVRELERQLLESHGYQVDVAVDGMDGWNTVRSGNYDLVVSDVDMPRMDGIELVRRIKQDARLKNLPVVIVSYKDREEDRLRGLDAGANYYLTKSSFHDQTFLHAIEDLIGEARA
jgi:two-component system, chemotaxis family, sensor histidine kinase and response regulator WspE